MSEGKPKVQPPKPFWCKCALCAHTWVAAYYPADVDTFISQAMKNVRCPRCGGNGLVASQNNGDLLETKADKETQA